MNKLLYLTQVFEVFTDTGSDRDFHYCKYAVKHGLKVEVITSDVDYKKATKRADLSDGQKTKLVDGVLIHYVYSYKNFRGSFAKRLIYYFSYIVPTIIRSIRVRNVSCVYAVSTPLIVGLIAYIVSRIKRVDFIFEVTDIWPDAAVECGVVKNNLLIRLAKSLELFCYKKASHIIVIAEHAKRNIIGKGIAADKISVVTNGVDISLFNIIKNDEQLRQYRPPFLRDGSSFIVMYLGAHGAYNSLNTIIESAAILKQYKDIKFVFVGDGDEKKNLKRMVSDNHLQNVLFFDPIPRSQTPYLLFSADLFVLPNRKGAFFEGNLPNKFFDFMISGKPIVAAAKGEIEDVINSANCGAVVEPENSQDFATEIKRFYDMGASDRERVGNNGREFVSANYDRNVLSAKIHSIVKSCINN